MHTSFLLLPIISVSAWSRISWFAFTNVSSVHDSKLANVPRNIKVLNHLYLVVKAFHNLILVNTFWGFVIFFQRCLIILLNDNTLKNNWIVLLPYILLRLFTSARTPSRCSSCLSLNHSLISPRFTATQAFTDISFSSINLVVAYTYTLCYTEWVSLMLPMANTAHRNDKQVFCYVSLKEASYK